MVKILHTIASADPAGGGPIVAVEQLARVHQQWGHTVEVACLDDPGSPWLDRTDLKVHALGPARTGYRYASRFVPWLQAHAAGYDCIVVNGLWQYAGFGVWLARLPVPYFVFTHGMLDPWFKRAYPLKHLKKWLYWPWAEYQVLKDARAVLFTCEEERLLARQSFWLYRCTERVVSLGIAPPEGDPEHQRTLFFDHFPQLSGKRLLLFLGRLHVKKGCDLLIEAFARAATDESLHLVMAGPDQTGWQVELEAQARQLGVANRLHWTGMLTGDLKWGALRAAEVFVLPSHQENFGIAVVEALACGLPVLISNKVNIWREIEADGAGFVEDDDLEGTVRLLRRWLSLSDAERNTSQERARASFDRRFEVQSAAKLLLDALRS